MTATEKRSTARRSDWQLDGVLFLTAGYGSRAEPLSFARPKCLLPAGEDTVLGRLVEQFTPLKPKRMAFNASRCPELIEEEVRRKWKGPLEVLFEERPLGASATMARNSGLLSGRWALCNTDFVMDLPVADMLEQHCSSGSAWTVLTCPAPETGGYGLLSFDGKPMHYAGVSIVEPLVSRIAAEGQISGGVFSELLSSVRGRGYTMTNFFTENRWMDMGETELYRNGCLSLSRRFTAETASIEGSASLGGFYHIGSFCIIQGEASVSNSVFLPGSELAPGAVADECVVPWYEKRGSH